MLVLSRKPGERILIGNDIVVTVVRFQGGTVRLGIEAPREFAVVREELTNGDTTPVPEPPADRSQADRSQADRLPADRLPAESSAADSRQ
jgi:carbon storage regulator